MFTATGKRRRPKDAAYERKKEAARAREAKQSRTGRDIAPLPPVADHERHAAAEASFRVFCETYLPRVFSLPWSEDHKTVLARMDQCATAGGLFALAMPRGDGKTSLCLAGCLWAAITGRREFVVLIGSEQSSAEEMLAALKIELQTNDLLAADWPEVVYPIRRLEGIAHRCNGQLFDGRPTHIKWTKDAIVLPTVPGSKASGCVLKVAGLTGRLRGMIHKRPDGRAVRPSLVILDDPQTDESARIPSQCDTRERLILGAVLGLAGPGEKIAAVMPCTVIHRDDLADRLLDRERNPQWQGTKTSLVYAWPTAETLWEQYARAREAGLRAGRGAEDANTFYAAHRAEMDAGARVAWPERFEPDELSAIQHAWNLRLDRKAAFWSEYQNQPQDEATDGDEIRDPRLIVRRTNGHPRGELPPNAEHVTLYVDVHDRLLYWAAVAWAADFTGAVVDYGTWPDQRQRYFTMAAATRTLARATPGAGREGAILAGLSAVLDAQLARQWQRTDGARFAVARCLIDSGYMPDLVHQAIRAGNHLAVASPSKGIGIDAAAKPFSEYTRHPGDKHGIYWRMPAVKNRRELRAAHIDTNFWKSFVHARLATAPGDPGALTLFGTDAEAHRLLADHVTAETPTPTEGRGRKVVAWRLPPAKPDNHWFDCLVGCAVAASMLGAALPGSDAAASGTPKKRIRFADRRERRM